MVEPVEILRYARDVVLSDESKWFRGGISDSQGPLFDAEREDVPECEEGVVRGEKFCTLWSIVRARWELTGEFGVYGGLGDCEFQDLFDGLLGMPTWDWNDTRATYSDVIDLFDAAIKTLEEQ